MNARSKSHLSLFVNSAAFLAWIVISSISFAGGAAVGGAWAIGHFENDSALDFLTMLNGEKIEEQLQLAVTLSSGGYIEEDAGIRALVAAELIASRRDGDMGKMPDMARDIASRMKELPSSELIASARSAIESVLHSSETRDLRAELGGSEFKGWQAQVERLIARLR